MGLFHVFSRSTGSYRSRKGLKNGRSWVLVRPEGSDEICIHNTTDSSETPDEEVTVSSNGAGDAGTSSTRSDSRAVDQAARDIVLQVDSRAMNESKAADEKGLESRSSGETKQSKGSRKLAGFRTLLRSRKAQRQKIASDLVDAPIQPDVKSASIEPDESKTDGEISRTYLEFSLQRLGDNVQDKFKTEQEDPETRKVSSHTVDSKCTVCHCPSKRSSTPIAVVDKEDPFEAPGYECLDISQSGSGSNPFTDPRRSTAHSTRPSSFACSDGNSQYGYQTEGIEMVQNPVVRRRSVNSARLSRASSRTRMSSGSSYLSDRLKKEAIDEFNALAGGLHLNPLTWSQTEEAKLKTAKPPCDALKEPLPVEETVPSRRDRIIHRIRSMRSSLQMRSEPLPQERKPRRMKTFSDLSSRPVQMTALKGKSLETLARLGGHSYLQLPGDFAPATLKLPSCFAVTIAYLKRFAPAVPNVFVDLGDVELATEMYDQFAKQVLSAEKYEDKIEITLRRNTIPLDESDIIDGDHPIRSPLRVLSVGWVLKALLAGLPGGILGSKHLYDALVDIYYGRISEYEIDRTSSCLEGISTIDSTRAKAMALAILALTSTMQLELICAVFGLFAVLVYEEEQRLMKRWDRRLRRQGPITLGDELAGVVRPFLTEPEGRRRDTFGVVKREVDGERVAVMLIENWRNVSRQLRAWERGFTG